MPDDFDEIVNEAIHDRPPPRQSGESPEAIRRRMAGKPPTPESARPRRRQRTDPGILVIVLYFLAFTVAAAGILGALVIAGQEGGVPVALAAGLGSIICAALLAAVGMGLTIVSEINDAT